jgi:hypothetical protein
MTAAPAHEWFQVKGLIAARPTTHVRYRGHTGNVPDIIQTMEIAVSRTIKFARAGGPDVLEFIEAQVSAPKPREVRIKVKAIGINRAESMWRNDKTRPPRLTPSRSLRTLSC